MVVIMNKIIVIESHKNLGIFEETQAGNRQGGNHKWGYYLSRVNIPLCRSLVVRNLREIIWLLCILSDFIWFLYDFIWFLYDYYLFGGGTSFFNSPIFSILTFFRINNGWPDYERSSGNSNVRTFFCIAQKMAPNHMKSLSIIWRRWSQDGSM